MSIHLSEREQYHAGHELERAFHRLRAERDRLAAENERLRERVAELEGQS